MIFMIAMMMIVMMVMRTSTNKTAAATATTIIHTGSPSAGTASTSTKVNPALENRVREAEL